MKETPLPNIIFLIRETLRHFIIRQLISTEGQNVLHSRLKKKIEILFYFVTAQTTTHLRCSKSVPHPPTLLGVIRCDAKRFPMVEGVFYFFLIFFMAEGGTRRDLKSKTRQLKVWRDDLCLFGGRGKLKCIYGRRTEMLGDWVIKIAARVGWALEETILRAECTVTQTAFSK